MWSLVGEKGNQQWIWLALDVQTREIVGVHVGDRDAEGARGLWRSLPAVYRQCATAYTDFWTSHEGIFPATRHRPSAKSSGKTSLIERLNNTLRQRISRLVRKTLSFSKKLQSHLGSIWLFVHHYNTTVKARL
jgi:insertion element IS1 protein InsB